jgi:hypothetical protein
MCVSPEAAAAAAVKQPEIVLTEELLELFAERYEEIGDPNHSLLETVFVINGVRIVLK